LHWRNARFRIGALREIARADFFLEHIFPIIVAGWCVWIPGVSLVYFMPSALQLPVAVLIQIFWVLILTTITERRVNEPSDTTIQPLT
jgi:membrane protein implicated in regulation of membrane protease activity